MTRWEYQFALSRDGEWIYSDTRSAPQKVEAFLELMGNAGWELAAVIPSASGYKLTLKRAIIEP